MHSPQEELLNTLTDWVADPTCQGNAMTLTVAGIVFANEEKYVEALKACHTGLSLEMCVILFSTAAHAHAGTGWEAVYLSSMMHVGQAIAC